jgi:LacI family transcriptional regulator
VIQRFFDVKVLREQVFGEGLDMGSSTRPTLKDVAREAGVSITTASVVLNDKRDGVRVTESTRARVRHAADELGYRPNQMARDLRQRSSRAIGFVSDRVTTTPFAVAMLAGAQDVAAEEGHLLFVVNATGPDGGLLLAEAMDELVTHQVSRFVVAAMGHRGVDPSPGLPESTVFVNAFATRGGYRSIVPDERGAAAAAVEELLDHGHRRIAFLDDNTGTVASPLRFEGYRDALRARGQDPDPRLHVRLAPTQPGGELGGQLLDLHDDVRPTAVFCFNDRAAMGLYRAARRRGLEVPADLSVVGFDDQEFIAPELQPGLTTMRLPHEEMGRLAVRTVLGLDSPADGWQPAGAGTIARVPCPIVRRASVAAPPQ